MNRAVLENRQKEAKVVVREEGHERTVAVKYRYASGQALLVWLDPSFKTQTDNLYLCKVA